MLRAARSQSLSVFTTWAGDLKPSGNSTVICPAASRTTCQLRHDQAKLPADIDERSAAIGNAVLFRNDNAGYRRKRRSRCEASGLRPRGGYWPVHGRIFGMPAGRLGTCRMGNCARAGCAAAKKRKRGGEDQKSRRYHACADMPQTAGAVGADPITGQPGGWTLRTSKNRHAR